MQKKKKKKQICAKIQETPSQQVEHQEHRQQDYLHVNMMFLTYILQHKNKPNQFSDSLGSCCQVAMCWAYTLSHSAFYTHQSAAGKYKKKAGATFLFKVTTVSYIMCAWLVDIHSTYSHYRFVFQVNFCEVTDCLWEWHYLNEGGKTRYFLRSIFWPLEPPCGSEWYITRNTSNRCLTDLPTKTTLKQGT